MEFFFCCSASITRDCRKFQKWAKVLRITKLRIQNFRSLKDTEIDLEHYLTVVVGKNNSGKTSFLLALDRFLGGSLTPKFEFDDFNVDLQTTLPSLIQDEVPTPEAFGFCGILLRLFIEYDSDDDLANVGDKVIMDLDPDNRWIVLDFLYHLPYAGLLDIRKAFSAHRQKKTEASKAPKSASDFVREEFRHHFKIARRSLRFDHREEAVVEDDFIDLIKENVRVDDIVAFKHINARRSVSNKEKDRGLSTMSARIYKAIATEADDGEAVETFKDALSVTDEELNKIYEQLFGEVIDDVRRFGGLKEGDTRLLVMSNLRQSDMLEANTTVKYGHGHGTEVLPETYNGLGYLNLIGMIFEIKILLNEFRREISAKPADINILFIEEPEAHTHPQMQAVFIKNIKQLVGKSILNANGIRRPLQTVVSTHSSHIVAESDFDDIKYFQKSAGSTNSRNLKDLEKLYAKTGQLGHYKFLKQYLTLNRSPLFFADKAILVEGDTERILLPAMMRKIDQRHDSDAYQMGTTAPLALLSQNISIVEVGAHSHIYEIFLDFIGVKTLIITDIDSAKEEDVIRKGVVVLNDDGTPRREKRASAIEGAMYTTNYALQFYHGKKDALDYYLGLELSQKTVRKDLESGVWSAHSEGSVMCVFQIAEHDEDGDRYHARSFEDAFFHVNRRFVATAHAQVPTTFGFPSLTPKHLRKYLNDGGSSFDLAVNGITKKPSFAIEILLNSSTETVTVSAPDDKKRDFDFEFANWKTPLYIEEGLEWIKRD